jgi:FlaA1/EpsC-like NDP-sugar epimerase
LKKKPFYKPTKLFREYFLLDMIEKNPFTTQRKMSYFLNLSVSLINDYLNQYEKLKLIIKNKVLSKNVQYFITKSGIERRKFLNILYLNDAQKIYNYAKENIEFFLISIEKQGFKNILLYGAGEVCELFLNTIQNNKESQLNVPAVIDDDNNKFGGIIQGIKVLDIRNIKKLQNDGILISSYTHSEAILKTLKKLNYPVSKIIFFDLDTFSQ